MPVRTRGGCLARGSSAEAAELWMPSSCLSVRASLGPGSLAKGGRGQHCSAKLWQPPKGGRAGQCSGKVCCGSRVIALDAGT